MPPEIPPPDDARRPPPSEGNVVDSEVLAERRAQRAEQAEQSAARRAADAQVLAGELARERARLEAERDAARAEASAAREGADAAIAEARHLQAERDTLRTALDEARAERDALAAKAGAAGGATDRVTPGTSAADAPRSDAPTSDAPRSDAPRSDAPRSDVPRSDAATSDAPTSDAPTSDPPAGAPPAGTVGDAGEPVGAPANGARNGNGVPPAAWAAALRRELTVARTAAAIAQPDAAPAPPSIPVPGLARERRLVAQRAAAGPNPTAKALLAAGAPQRRGDRAAPITALALERERSSRLQAQLDNSLAVQRELRTHIAALQRAVHQRVEAERRIEMALRRVREELTAASTLAVGGAESPARSAPLAPERVRPLPRTEDGTAAPGAAPMPSDHSTTAPLEPAPAAPPAPPTEATSPGPQVVQEAALPSSALPAAPATAAPTRAAAQPASALDPLRLSAARERLRAAVPATAPLSALPAGTPAPWLTAALKRLLASEPETAGRIVVGLLPAQGLVAERPLRYDLLLAGRGCLAIDVEPGASAHVVSRPAPRPRSGRDLSVAGDAAGFARLLHGRRSLRRPARVRGGRRALRELRRIARAPLGLRDLGSAGVALEPALALRLVALAIDPAATQGERFAVAHAPLAGGPVDAWLRIADGAEPEVCDRAPAEAVRLTLRCTRGALLALIAGVDPPAGEAGSFEGDDAALALLRSWIAQTEHPAA